MKPKREIVFHSTIYFNLKIRLFITIFPRGKTEINNLTENLKSIQLYTRITLIAHKVNKQ
ncbi:TPA: hypothetical protein DCX66_00120 [Candidatus Nomurabacteria bacterium]|nr:hypothetical protein [Candidatus Nomurabacteria bacterium]HAX64874.1 hypothetical protein [Candidatus Nomurabacteria bacterium]HCU01626.1 hypothetical protein [Candidatus Nomurabacteria bacterium]